jgi:hypothetical protein
VKRSTSRPAGVGLASKRICTAERLGNLSDFLNSNHGRRFLFLAADLGKTLFDFFGAALRHVTQSAEDQGHHLRVRRYDNFETSRT